MLQAVEVLASMRRGKAEDIAVKVRDEHVRECHDNSGMQEVASDAKKCCAIQHVPQQEPEWLRVMMMMMMMMMTKTS